MSEKPLTDAQQQQQLAEAKQKFEAAKATLDKGAKRARDGWVDRIARLKTELAEARAMQADAEDRRDRLVPHMDMDAQAAEFGTRMILLARLNAALGDMKAREIACYENCVALVDGIGPLETDPPPAVPRFSLPANDAQYLEARSTFDAYTLAYHWRRHRDALDGILRASGQEGTPGQTPEAEAERKRIGDQLRAAAKEDKPLMLALVKLGQDLSDARALLEWALTRLQTLPQMQDEARRGALVDTDWAKLNGSVHVLLTLKEQVAAHPALVAELAEKPFPATPAAPAEPAAEALDDPLSAIDL